MGTLRRKARRRRGFTLVELLITVGTEGVTMGVRKEFAELEAKAFKADIDSRTHMRKAWRIFKNYHNRSWKRERAQKRANVRWISELALGYAALEQNLAVWEEFGEIIKDYDHDGAVIAREVWAKGRDDMEENLRYLKDIGVTMMSYGGNHAG